MRPLPCPVPGLPVFRPLALTLLVAAAGCGAQGVTTDDASIGGGAGDGGSSPDAATTPPAPDGGAAAPCDSRTYFEAPAWPQVFTVCDAFGS